MVNQPTEAFANSTNPSAFYLAELNRCATILLHMEDKQGEPFLAVLADLYNNIDRLPTVQSAPVISDILDQMPASAKRLIAAHMYIKATDGLSGTGQSVLNRFILAETLAQGNLRGEAKHLFSTLWNELSGAPTAYFVELLDETYKMKSSGANLLSSQLCSDLDTALVGRVNDFARQKPLENKASDEAIADKLFGLLVHHESADMFDRKAIMIFDRLPLSLKVQFAMDLATDYRALLKMDEETGRAEVSHPLLKRFGNTNAELLFSAVFDKDRLEAYFNKADAKAAPAPAAP